MGAMKQPETRGEARLRGLRREPPAFRRVHVVRVERLTSRMTGITVSGPDLTGFAVEQPAASVRLLIPAPGSVELVVPEWKGNEFLLPDGSRPAIRTLTPRRVSTQPLELDLDVVIAHRGILADWARNASAGNPAAVSGPGRGYEIDREAREFVLAGDETAIPAIGQLLEQLPDHTQVTVLVEAGNRTAEMELPPHPGATVEWIRARAGEPPAMTLAERFESLDIPAGARLWAAGEAAAMQRIRRHVFGVLGLARSRATVRGYWKWGRAGPG